jgi:hypothetical protein
MLIVYLPNLWAITCVRLSYMDVEHTLVYIMWRDSSVDWTTDITPEVTGSILGYFQRHFSETFSVFLTFLEVYR